MALSPNQHPNSSRMRLTESGDWAYSWGISEHGNSSRSSDHCGGEYFFGGRGMAFAQHSAVGSFHHASNHAVAAMDGVRRLNNSTFVESIMAGANSSARFQVATLQTMSLVSCGSELHFEQPPTAQRRWAEALLPLLYVIPRGYSRPLPLHPPNLQAKVCLLQLSPINEYASKELLMTCYWTKIWSNILGQRGH